MHKQTKKIPEWGNVEVYNKHKYLTPAVKKIIECDSGNTAIELKTMIIGEGVSGYSFAIYKDEVKKVVVIFKKLDKSIITLIKGGSDANDYTAISMRYNQDTYKFMSRCNADSAWRIEIVPTVNDTKVFADKFMDEKGLFSIDKTLQSLSKVNLTTPTAVVNGVGDVKDITIHGISIGKFVKGGIRLAKDNKLYKRFSEIDKGIQYIYKHMEKNSSRKHLACGKVTLTGELSYITDLYCTGKPAFLTTSTI